MRRSSRPEELIGRRIKATDWANLNQDILYESMHRGEFVPCWTRDIGSGNVMKTTGEREERDSEAFVPYEYPKICLGMRIRLLKENEVENFCIKEAKGEDGIVIYHTLQFGEYTNTKIEVNENVSNQFENLYNGGKLKDGISTDGTWFSGNGDIGKYSSDDSYDVVVNKNGYKGKHSPVFEYNGERYARYCFTNLGGELEVRWVKVEPITFIIANWDRLPEYINPNGTGQDDFIELETEKAIIGGIPFYQNQYERYGRVYQNSDPRGFLNGIDVRNITENGNLEYSVLRGANFEGVCNFLYQAFNLEREGMTEHTIPDSEKIIPNDAYHGCITLKKLQIHSGITAIGKRAFEAVSFKYAYRTLDGNLVLSEELPQNKEDYEYPIELYKLEKYIIGFNYEILLEIDKLNEICEGLKQLESKDFCIPNEYAIELVKEGRFQAFCVNSNFEFLKSEYSEIYNLLDSCSEEARLNIFKFAANLGCFSEKKVLDKEGKETDEYIAQKACATLAQIIEEERMCFDNFDWSWERRLFGKMPLESEPNQDFLEFIADSQNLKMLLSLEEEHANIFSKVMLNFDKVKLYKEKISQERKGSNVSWEEALTMFVQEEARKNQDVADLLEKYNSEVPVDELAGEIADLRKKAKENDAPDHILGVSIIEEIDGIVEGTKKELSDIGPNVVRTADKLFRYEWISKRDSANLIALLWDTVDNIDDELESFYYTADKTSMFARDVQNLVIRNSEDKIIARSTVYVNKQSGYAVINGCKISCDYDYGNEDGKNQILTAVKRGIYAFIEKYDEQNPESPLQQVNLGIEIVGGNGDIPLSVIWDHENRVEGKLLDVPFEYGFTAAMGNQYILYKRKENTKEERSN